MRYCLIHCCSPNIVIHDGKRWFECCWWQHLEDTGHTECPKCHKEIFIDSEDCPHCGTKLIFRAGQFYWLLGHKNVLE